MNQRSIFTSSSKSRLKMIVMSCCLLMLSYVGRAAVIVLPTYPETLLATLSAPIYTLNSDMLETPSGKLFVMAWDLYGPTSGVNLQLGDDAGNVTSYFIPTIAESLPDVVLANDPANASQYIIAVVYRNATYGIQFDTYTITGVGTSSLAIAPRTHTLVAASGLYPHIDMFTDFTTIVNGFPSMHKFVISYAFGSPSAYDVYERHGDVASAVTLSSPFAVVTGGACTYGGDVACAMDPATHRQHVYFAVTNGFNLYKAQIDLNPTASPIAPPIGPATSTLLYTGPGPDGPLLPRIEAMGYNPTGSGMVPWVIGATISNASSGTHQIWEFNDAVPGGFNCTNPLLAPYESMCVEVCAGSGMPNGNICNKFYNIGWHSSKPGFITQAIDAYTGNISTAFPDYYWANTITYPGFSSSKVPIAITSSSNSGNDMFTGWWDNIYSAGGNIYYKLKPGVDVYRPLAPTGIGNVTGAARITVFPNPTSDKLIIQGDVKATYTITNIAGQMLASGKINGTDYNLDVSEFATGAYVLTLTSNAGTQVTKFTKQ